VLWVFLSVTFRAIRTRSFRGGFVTSRCCSRGRRRRVFVFRGSFVSLLLGRSLDFFIFFEFSHKLRDVMITLMIVCSRVSLFRFFLVCLLLALAQPSPHLPQHSSQPSEAQVRSFGSQFCSLRLTENDERCERLLLGLFLLLLLLDLFRSS